ncbi:MAG: AI-2E family transporter [Clostridium sp.]|uniref:AI-2E family transporter n=1 Tax=uncultured Clostridium sp. TaxID=59620 RepID=UPI002670D42D|nr:AI-2E family transporter [uncultured Clostridium sp.]
MKVEWNKKYTTIAIYAFLVISSSIIVYLMVSQAEDLKIKFSGMIATMQPFIIGSAIAYIINFILNFYEKVVFELKYLNKLNRKYRRGIGLLLSYLTAIIVISLFMQFVLPQLVDSIVGLANNIPQYVNDASHVITEISEKFNLESKYMNMIVEKWNELLNYIITLLTNLIPVIGNFIMTLGSSILNVIIGIIVSIYILIDKEKFIALSRKVTFSIFSAERSKRIVELAQRSNETFGKFLSGKILDSLIIGILTFIILTIFKMPYILLISVVIGITNIIPFFGPFFGAIPSAIIILCVSPIKALWFIGIILVIQQIDGNIIGPKILGDSIGISAFWILFSLLIFAKFLGLIGMIIGVPIFAIIYSIIKENVERRLKAKGLPVETEKYK